MNILVIPSWFPLDSAPQRGVFFWEQALALKKAGHNVVFLCVSCYPMRDVLQNHFRPLIREKESDGVIRIDYGEPTWLAQKFNCHMERLTCVMKNALKYAAEKYGAFDVIHAHSFVVAGYVVCRNKSVLQIPVVVTEHSSLIANSGLDGKQLSQLDYTVQNADLFFAVSEALKNSIDNTVSVPRTIQVLPNIVSSRFCYRKDRPKFEKFTFLSVGNLIELKRHSLAIDAFCEAFTKDDNIQFLICGQGEKRSELEQQIDRLGRSHQIKLLGQQNREQVVRLMQQSHIFVHASRYETFGVVIIEALSCGIPVIGTRNGGSDMLLENYGATAVEVNNQRQLSTIMVKQYHNYGCFDPEKISGDCIAQYSETAVVNKLEEAYRSLI